MCIRDRDVDTNDWRKPGSSVVAARAVNVAKPGSIILVHDIHASTVAAVDAIVKGLDVYKRQGQA